MSKLIVNADDFGLHSAVNAGIIDGHRRGIITSTSLMAGGEAFTEAVSMAKQNPKLGIGIHITLVGGVKPVCDPSEVSSLLTPEGVFPENYVEFIKRILCKALIVLRTVLSLKGSTVPFIKNIPFTPAATAVRIMVPRLPGS